MRAPLLMRPAMRTLGIVWLAWLAVGSASLPAEEPAAPSAYRLAGGDVIQVDVFGEPDMSMEEPLSHRGTIHYWLLGELKVEGMTVEQVERLLTERLAGRYLVNPRVTVSVAKYRPFFALGQVANPGSYQYLPGLTVGQAITMAGGFTERASRRKIFIVREGHSSDDRERVRLEDPIYPGDTLTVEQGFF